MMEISKINKQEINDNRVDHLTSDDYYKVVVGDKIVCIFGVSRNSLHTRNLYLSIVRINNSKALDIIRYIKSYFNAPLQVMLDSNKKEIINLLEGSGFKCVRRCIPTGSPSEKH